MRGELFAYLDGVHVGVFTQTDQGGLTFEYDDDYRADETATPLSLSMPLIRRSHRKAAAHAYLQGLLPDSEGRRRELGTQHQVSYRNAFALLSHIGRDAAGAVQLLSEGEASTDAATRAGDVKRHSEADFAEIVRDLIDNASTWGKRGAGQWSLPGAQPKTALLRTDDGGWATPLDSTPTTHIIKPAVPPYAEHHVNEFMTMAAARHLGLDVARSEIVTTSLGDGVFVSVRYDRVQREGRWVRLHQEDFCQSLSVEPEGKYQSEGGPGVARIAQLFRDNPYREDREVNASRFFEALVFNLAAVGTDAHAKNYSFLLQGSRAVLAPLYDLGTHAPYSTVDNRGFRLAMSLDGEYAVDRVGLKALLVTARTLGVDADWAEERARHILSNVSSAFQQAATDAAVVLSDHTAIARVADAVAANAIARGWET